MRGSSRTTKSKEKGSISGQMALCTLDIFCRINKDSKQLRVRSEKEDRTKEEKNALLTSTRKPRKETGRRSTDNLFLFALAFV